MSELTVSLREAKARLSALSERAAAGNGVLITKRGRPVARLVSADEPTKPVDIARLRALTDRQPCQLVDAGQYIRDMREAARY